MQITITNQALQCIYIIWNQHKEKTQERIALLDRMFDAIEDSVTEFEVQMKSMKQQGDELTLKSQNTALKQEVRDQAEKDIIELDKTFQAVHFSCVAIDVPRDIVEMMNDVIHTAMEQEKFVWRRNIKCATQAMFAIDEYLANA